MMRNKVFCMDVLAGLKQLGDNSVNCIITSPPYWGLRDYQVDGQIGLEPTLEEYLGKLLKVTKELYRVLRDDGVLFWNHGDNYGGTGAKGEWKDPKNPEGRNQREGLTQNFMPKCLCLQNYRLIMRMVDEQGWILRNVVIWHKPNHMPSSVRDRFANAYEPVFVLVKSKKYWFDLDAVRKPTVSAIPGHPSYRKKIVEATKEKPAVFHSTKNIRVNKEGKEGGLYFKDRYYNPLGGNPGDVWVYNEDEDEPSSWKDFKQRKAYARRVLGLNHDSCLDSPNGSNPGDCWTISTQPFSEAHFATFPEKLVEPMILAGCPVEVCKKCGEARTRITKEEYTPRHLFPKGHPSYRPITTKIGFEEHGKYKKGGLKEGVEKPQNMRLGIACKSSKTLGWSDCGCGEGFIPGLVLDPFIGSGTVGLVARKLGRDFVGIDNNPAYCEMANKRLKGWIQQERLQTFV